MPFQCSTHFAGHFELSVTFEENVSLSDTLCALFARHFCFLIHSLFLLLHCVPFLRPHLHHLPSLIFHASFSLSPPEPPVFLSSVILACVSLSTAPCTFKSMCYSSLSLMPSVCCILSFFCFCPSFLSIFLSALSEMASADARLLPSHALIFQSL